MLHLALLASLALATLPLTTANHVTCSWDGPGQDPEKAGFAKYCEADQRKDDLTHVTFPCGIYQNTVADWGYLAKDTLEFATPCNGDGYGSDDDCQHQLWGVCVASRTGKTRECLYMSKDDDCQWPVTFTLKTLPEKVIIYSK